jgi:hypothetical protein
VQAEKEAAEASTDMITKEFEKLLEDKQKINAEKQDLEARYLRLQERLEYLECIAGHGEDCDNEHDHVQGYVASIIALVLSSVVADSMLPDCVCGMCGLDK